MHTLDIIRAWKDQAYRNSLSAAELAQLPANPIGMIELSDAELDGAAGGIITLTISGICCGPTLLGTCEMGTDGCCYEQLQ